MEWHVVNAATDAILIVDEQSRTVCEITNEDDVTPEDDAHAQLIAAAPALLAACERMLAYVSDRNSPPSECSGALSDMRVAVNRAKGE